MLISLAITALLLTATMVAIDTSFKAYAAAAETASTQASTRMVVNRLLTLIRTSRAVGPDNPSVIAPYDADYMEILDSQGGNLRFVYFDADHTVADRRRQLWLQQGYATAGGGWVTTSEQPMLDHVEDCRFTLINVESDDVAGMWQVVRGTIYLKVAAERDNTLAIENGNREPIIAIASTMPRRIE